MNTSSLTNNEQLASLKSQYFEALKSFNETYSEAALDRLRVTEDAYMSFIESDDVRTFR